VTGVQTCALPICQIQNQKMIPSPAGQIAVTRWHTIPDHYPDVELDAFVVMPNHIHGILVLTGKTDFTTILGRVMNAYKGAVTAAIRASSNTKIIVWQSRYHDHIIRNGDELNRIRLYVANNPANWNGDRYG